MNGAQARPLSIYLVAAEESGDALGAALVRALRSDTGGALVLAGVGGRAMAAEGVVSPFPTDDLAIVGVSAIPARLRLILRRIRETADAVIAARPDALVIIDSPDFTHRVARRVQVRAPLRSDRRLSVFAALVWAWRSGRARAMRAYVDCVLAILPFEPAAHQRLGGPPCVYVGHPLIERLSDLRPNPREAERRRSSPPLVLVLPGSRSSEIRLLLAVFGEAIANLHARVGDIELVLPTMPHLAARVAAGVANWAVKPRIVTEPAEKWAAFRNARAALAASGTVTLELALAGVPTVAAYRLTLVEEIIARVARIKQRLASIILANLVLGENIVPELLQHDCTPERLAAALAPLLSDTPEWRRQIGAFARLDSIMALDTLPSARAAAVVLEAARSGRPPHRTTTAVS